MSLSYRQAWLLGYRVVMCQPRLVAPLTKPSRHAER